MRATAWGSARTWAVAAGLGVAGLGATQAQAADALQGGRLYAAQCAMCHGPTGAGGAGPALTGVVGRKAAAAAFPYSAALKKAAWTWDALRLDKYLSNPQATAPGTTMPVVVAAAKDRADLIAYMAAFKPAAPTSSKPAARKAG